MISLQLSIEDIDNRQMNQKNAFNCPKCSKKYPDVTAFMKGGIISLMLDKQLRQCCHCRRVNAAYRIYKKAKVSRMIHKLPAKNSFSASDEENDDADEEEDFIPGSDDIGSEMEISPLQCIGSKK